MPHGAAYEASTTRWCTDAAEADDHSSVKVELTRNGCASDAACLAEGRKHCDANDKCFGIMYYPPNVNQPFQFCSSITMGTHMLGWHSMMKQWDPTIVRKSNTSQWELWYGE